MQVKVLIEGYAKEENGSEHSSCSTVLIRDDKNNIVVDPGANRGLLIENLKKEGLNPSDINIVLLTHTHLDHSLLVGLFENAKIYDDSLIYYMDSKIEEQKEKISENIEFIKTPGHDQFHMSILIKNTENGNTVISGDVFWWWNSEEYKTDTDSLLSREDPFVKNTEDLLVSRKQLLSIADYIIPGHGKAFYVKHDNY